MTMHITVRVGSYALYYSLEEVTLQDCSPPAAAPPGLEGVRAEPPQAAKPAPLQTPRELP